MVNHPLYQAIKKRLLLKDRIIVAIDGPCASGKTTLANELATLLPANVYHCDDFYLSPSQKQTVDKTLPGWNIDANRFIDEVLKPLVAGHTVHYKKYNCLTGQFEQATDIVNKQIEIVEGSYSLRPDFREYYDITCYLEADYITRQTRIRTRNGIDKLEEFNRLWIPLENNYFDYYRIAEIADISIIHR